MPFLCCTYKIILYHNEWPFVFSLITYHLTILHLIKQDYRVKVIFIKDPSVEVKHEIVIIIHYMKCDQS
jgi:hypothetical protein